MSDEGFTPRERPLPDDYPVYGDYVYIVDGCIYRSDWHGITVGDLKLRLKAKEVRNCDIYGRRALATSSDPSEDRQ